MNKWISVKDRLPKSKDDSVLVYFGDCTIKGIDMVHIQDYFDDITNGLDGYKKQLYTKFYINQGITHWTLLPEPPEVN